VPRHSQQCIACGFTEDVHVAPFEVVPCSRCGGAAERLWQGAAAAVRQDSIEGGQWFENGWSVPRKFYSHSEHRRALDAAGLEIRAKNAGPNDKHCPRWDTVDLEAAAALVRRGEEARAAKDTRWADAKADITVTVLDEAVKARDLAD